jgi:hypothetical protein
LANDTQQISNNRARCFLDELGNPYGIKHVANKPRVSCMPYTYDIVEGNIASHSPVRRSGKNNDVGTAFEVVAQAGGTYYWPAAVGKMNVVSTDADDDGAPVGNGARTVRIKGLDTDYAIITDTIILNGTTTVVSNLDFLRVLLVEVMTMGTSGTNEGTITVKDATDAYTFATIGIAEGRSSAVVFTVPADQTFYMTSWDASEDSNKGTEVAIYKRDFGMAWQQLRLKKIINFAFDFPFDLPLKFDEKTDVMIQAKGLLASAKVQAGFEGWRETN